MTLEELDAKVITDSEWEAVLISTEDAIVKVVCVGYGGYRVITYKRNGSNWLLAWSSFSVDPTAEEMIDAIAGALSKR